MKNYEVNGAADRCGKENNKDDVREGDKAASYGRHSAAPDERGSAGHVRYLQLTEEQYATREANLREASKYAEQQLRWWDKKNKKNKKEGGYTIELLKQEIWGCLLYAESIRIEGPGLTARQLAFKHQSLLKHLSVIKLGVARLADPVSLTEKDKG